jgi:hypothetical protein
MVNGDSVLSLRDGRKADEAISPDSLSLKAFYRKQWQLFQSGVTED